MQTQPLRNHEVSKAILELDSFVEAASPNMVAVEAVVRELSQNQVPVLLLGEAGTGKHKIARRLHDGSPRHEVEFLTMDCGKVSTEDFDSRRGKLRFCQGTVFFEEVAKLDFACQRSFLEWLNRLDPADTRGQGGRLIYGSARDLESEVRCGRFLEDLFYSIGGVCLRLPPLRQRKQDIPSLMSFFLAKFSAEYGCPTPMLSRETSRLFSGYDWPGNIRELRDAARAIVVLGDESVAMRGLRAVLLKADRHRSSEQLPLKQIGKSASRETEKEIILEVLARTRWNRRRAAEELKISYKSLLYKLKAIGNSELEVS